MEREPDYAAWFALDPSVTYLNHGSYGACPRAILELQGELRRRLEAEPARFFSRSFEPLLDETRAVLAGFLGADPGGLVFVRNATEGVNAVLSSLQLDPGDELLTTDHAYGACKNALDHYAERWGARVTVATVPFPIQDPDQVVEAVLGAVRPRTRLALIDHVTSPTGLVFPIERLVAGLAQRGVETLVDGAHAPGMLDLALDRLGAAYYTGNAHKWLCTPKGSAFLWARPDRRDRLRPPVVGWGARSPRRDRSRLHLEFDWTGTHDPTAILCIPRALELLGGLLPGGWDALRARNRALVLEGRALLLEALDSPAPAPASMIGSLGAVLLPWTLGPSGESPDGIFDPLGTYLFDQHAIEVPVFPRPGAGQRVLRVSAQLYNRRRDYEALAAVLSGLRTEGGERPDRLGRHAE